jgi:hypothetical protein
MLRMDAPFVVRSAVGNEGEEPLVDAEEED